MCGIAGWLGHIADGEKSAKVIAGAMHHRGPDSHGIESWPMATLIHTRLSIIDLLPTGSQPMTNEDGTIWTVFNGEIYNHRELQRDLESRGHVFRGRSDTEVLPHLYEEMGADFITRLRGMFALAIYDTKTQRLLLARDRFGIKPLFYSPGARRLAFASEIKALLQLPDVSYKPDTQAIYDFAALLFIPAPETFYTDIRALEPGKMLEAALDGDTVSWRTRDYHRWTIAPDHTMTLDQAVEKADALVETAVARQMESDVALGALLSGGIDSSLVSASAQKALRGGLRTFNVRFEDKEYDETWAAVAVAQHIGSQHETLNIGGAGGSWENITSVLLHAGQPFADTSLFACDAVCRLMRQQLTVALSGDGGDEGFGGYNFYWWLTSLARWQMLPPVIWQGASIALTPLGRIGAIPSSLPERLNELSCADDIAVVQNLSCWIREREHRSLCRDSNVLPIRRLFEPQWEHHLPPGASRLERWSMLATEANVRLFLPNDYLFKLDLASMKQSMEIRVPMLDDDLFDFTLSLPHVLKVNGRTCKRVLRAIAHRRLPRSVADKPKRGFEVPMNGFVDENFKAALQNAVLGPSSRLTEYFQPATYRPIIDAFCAGYECPGISRQGIYERMIMLLSMQLTLEPGRI